jgi:Na+/melibiose symporter-like transporter
MDITIIPALIAIFIIGVIFYFPVSMAKSRGRSKIGWFFLSFIFTPILTMIILFLLGDTKEMRLKKIQEEEEQRIAIRQKYSMENKD